MAEKGKHKKFTATDIEKYHGGLLSSKEMHEIEKAALDDPFLADALEGYSRASGNLAADISELERKLHERINDPGVILMTPARRFQWWKIAAAVVIVGGIAFLVFRVSMSNKNPSLAKLEEKKPTIPLVDSNNPVKADTTVVTSVAKNKPNEQRAKAAIPKTNTLNNAARELGAASKSEVAVVNHSNQVNQARLDSAAKMEIAGASAPRANFIKSRNDEQPEGFLSKKQLMGLSSGEHRNSFRGQVVDANNNPLPFANVTNIRDSVGTYADAQGNFNLISSDTVLDVRVRSVGFENRISRLRNRAISNKIILREDKNLPYKILGFTRPDSAHLLKSAVKFEDAQPAAGWSNYNLYLANNIQLPDDFKEEQNKGEVEVSFDVNQDGEPVNIKVEKSLCQKCDGEAVRLVKEGPKWKKKNKNEKRVTLMVPFDPEQ